jgi:hypothetical protein
VRGQALIILSKTHASSTVRDPSHTQPHLVDLDGFRVRVLVAAQSPPRPATPRSIGPALKRWQSRILPRSLRPASHELPRIPVMRSSRANLQFPGGHRAFGSTAPSTCDPEPSPLSPRKCRRRPRASSELLGCARSQGTGDSPLRNASCRTLSEVWRSVPVYC